MSYKKIIFILCLGVFLSSERPASAQVTRVNFPYVSNTAQTWTVPSCVFQVTVQLWGGGGGAGDDDYNSGACAGGSGAYYEGVLGNLNAGMTLNLYVPSGGQYSTSGAGGSGGWPGGAQGGNDIYYYEYGGGGGGYAGITINGTYYVVAGAGAGGGSGDPSFEDCHGGGGGATTGGNGGNGENFSNNGFGNGGTISAGGLAGSSYDPSCEAGGNGTYLAGGLGGGLGACFVYEYGGGGGGAGYYGGGGGADGGGGGGGGSSFPGARFSTNGIIFTPISNLAGTQGNLPAAYVAPGTPPVGVGTGGYTSNGGNGYIIISYETDSVNTAAGNTISNIVCNGENTGAGSVLVNGQAGFAAFTYTWMPNVSSRDTATGLTAGTYTVNVSTGSCGSASTTVVITQPGFFAPTPIVNYPLCNGATGSIIGDATGGTLPYTYAFTPGGNVPAIYGLTAGSYSLNILDNRGCATSELIALTQPAAIAASASLLTAPNCYGGNGGSAIASVTGGTYPYAYAWSPSGGTNVGASNLTAGSYVLTVTDANGCNQTAPVTISQPAYLGVIVSPPLLNLACNGDNNGVLGSGISGGVRPYTYFWSNGLGSDTDVTELSAGTYYLTVTDAHGCRTIDSALVVQPPAMNLSIDSTFDAGHCSGSAWVILSGATPPYSYLWSNGSTFYYQSTLCAGEYYCCTVTDANNCKYNICTGIESDLGVGSISGTNTKIKVYPNPNSGQFTVDLSSASGNMTLEVYNVLGEKVYTQMSNGSSEMTINMSSKPNGIYLYRVISNENGNLVGEGKIDIER